MVTVIATGFNGDAVAAEPAIREEEDENAGENKMGKLFSSFSKFEDDDLDLPSFLKKSS